MAHQVTGPELTRISSPGNESAVAPSPWVSKNCQKPAPWRRVFISQSDFGATGFVADLPFTKYVLKEDIVFAAPALPGIAITISASNVIVDFEGHSIRGSGPNATNCIMLSRTGGVTPLDNVTVCSGSATQFTIRGILDNALSSNFTISNFSISFTGSRGIASNGNTMMRICNCRLHDFTSLNPLVVVAGIFLFRADRLRIENSSVYNLTGFSSFGIYVANGPALTTHIRMNSCKVANLASTGGNTRGIGVQSFTNPSEDVVIKRCSCDKLRPALRPGRARRLCRASSSQKRCLAPLPLQLA